MRIKLYEKAAGMDHAPPVINVNNQSVALLDQGKYEHANEMNRRTLTESDKVLRVDQPDALTSVSCLASLLNMKQGRQEGFSCSTVRLRVMLEYPVRYILLYRLYVAATTHKYQNLCPFLDIVQNFIDGVGSQRAA